MKIGTRFRRAGKRYELLGFVGKRSMRVRDLDSGCIVHILTPEAECEQRQKSRAKEQKTPAIEKKQHQKNRESEQRGILPLFDLEQLQKKRERFQREDAREKEQLQKKEQKAGKESSLQQRLRKEAEELFESVEALRRLREDYLRRMREDFIKAAWLEQRDMSDRDDDRLDKTALNVTSLFDDSEERIFWQTKSPQERLRAVELLRQIHYGYDPLTCRLQRVFEVARRS
jgi:hypothetical protein